MSEEQKEFEMVFDHSKAYEDDGEIGSRLIEVFQIAERHGCPILLMATVSDDGENTQLAIQKSKRNGMLPANMLLAEKMLHLQGEHFAIIERLIEIMEYASSNMEHIRADINNAAVRIMEKQQEEQKGINS